MKYVGYHEFGMPYDLLNQSFEWESEIGYVVPSHAVLRISFQCIASRRVAALYLSVFMVQIPDVFFGYTNTVLHIQKLFTCNKKLLSYNSTN